MFLIFQIVIRSRVIMSCPPFLLSRHFLNYAHFIYILHSVDRAKKPSDLFRLVRFLHSKNDYLLTVIAKLSKIQAQLTVLLKIFIRRKFFIFESIFVWTYICQVVITVLIYVLKEEIYLNLITEMHYFVCLIMSLNYS